MSKLATAPARAAKVKGPEEAARMYADVDTELGIGDYGEDDYQAGEQALRDLETKFPGVRQRAYDKVAYGGHVPKLSSSAQKALSEPAAPLQAQSKEEHAARKSQPGRSRKQRIASATVIHGRPRARARGRSRAQWAVRQTGVPAAAESVSQLALKTLGGILGLTFVFLLVNEKGNGPRAVQLGASGIEHSIAALISPTVDPLRSTNAAQAQIAKQETIQPAAGVTNSLEQITGAINGIAASVGAGQHRPTSAQNKIIVQAVH